MSGLYRGSILISIAIILFIESFFSLICIPFSLHYGEPSFPYLVSSLVMLIIGIFLFWLSGKLRIRSRNDSIVTARILLIWIILILAGTLPYLFNHRISSFLSVIFESTSGFTTTGLTTIKDIDDYPDINISELSDKVKIILSILMVTGRLEIYTIILALIPSTYKSQ